jgi:hypothetical protein
MSVRPSVRQSVCMEQLGSLWTDFYETVCLCIFGTLSRKLECHKNLVRTTGTLHEDRRTMVILSRPVLLRMRNVADKSCTQNQHKHFMFNNFFPKIVPFMR